MVHHTYSAAEGGVREGFIGLRNPVQVTLNSLDRCGGEDGCVIGV